MACPTSPGCHAAVHGGESGRHTVDVTSRHVYDAAPGLVVVHGFLSASDADALKADCDLLAHRHGRESWEQNYGRRDRIDFIDGQIVGEDDEDLGKYCFSGATRQEAFSAADRKKYLTVDDPQCAPLAELRGRVRSELRRLRGDGLLAPYPHPKLDRTPEWTCAEGLQDGMLALRYLLLQRFDDSSDHLLQHRDEMVSQASGGGKYFGPIVGISVGDEVTLRFSHTGEGTVGARLKKKLDIALPHGCMYVLWGDAAYKMFHGLPRLNEEVETVRYSITMRNARNIAPAPQAPPAKRPRARPPAVQAP